MRGSDDGFSYDSFWNKCDLINNGIVVIETEDSKNVFGGYTSKYFGKLEAQHHIEDDIENSELVDDGEGDASRELLAAGAVRASRTGDGPRLSMNNDDVVNK